MLEAPSCDAGGTRLAVDDHLGSKYVQDIPYWISTSFAINLQALGSLPAQDPETSAKGFFCSYSIDAPDYANTARPITSASIPLAVPSPFLSL